MIKRMNNKKVDLILEGGGVKGIGLVGAISELARAGYEFQRVAGTSAGAIVGSLVASGCSPRNIVEIMQSLEYKKFKDPTFLSRFVTPGKIASLLVHKGVYKGDYLKDWISDQLATCGVKTFGDLRLSGPDFVKLPPDVAYKLVIVTADLTKGELVYLPWDYHKYGLDPDQQDVATAIRTSMSIPFFFTPAHLGDSTFIDGGWLSNFPVNAFDEPRSAQPDWPTFGINLASTEDIELTPKKINGPLSFARAVFDTTLNGHDQRHLNNPSTLARTMFVDVGKILSTNFDITRAQQDILFRSGQQSARKFLGTWDYAAYKKQFPL